MKWQFGLSVLTLLIVGCSSNPAPQIENVILITLDTTRADALGAYGNKRIKTPVIDQLAREGNLFESCFSHAPITLPSHSSILTGKIPTQHGVRNNINYALPPETRRLPQIFKEHGYATAAFVSSFILDSRFGLDVGFDLYEDDIVHYSDHREEKEIVTRRAGITLERMMHWLDGQQDRPFFSWVHLYDAHAPYEAPLPFRQAYAGVPYYGEIAYMDYELGHLVKHLKDKGLYEKTLIIVTADHGDSFDEHGEQTHGFFCYGATTHVPLILSKPLYGKPGQHLSHQVQSIDLAPSILAALKFQPESSMDGISLDKTKKRLVYSEAIIPQEDFYLAPVHSLKDNDYSFYFSSTMELYDLKNDPKETKNLAETSPDLVKEYQAKMKTILDSVAQKDTSVSIDQESVELLRSLGYIADGGTQTAKESDPYKYRSPYQSIKVYRELQRLKAFENTYPFKMIEGLQKLVEEDRRQIVVYRDLGRLEAFAGNEEEAISNLKKAAHLKPEDPRLHTFLGLGYHRFGKYEESLKEFAVALKLSPTNQLARYNEALSLAGLGKFDEAEHAFELVLEQDPNDVLTLNNLAFLSLDRHKDPQKAKALIDRALALNSKNPLIMANKELIDQALAEQGQKP